MEHVAVGTHDGLLVTLAILIAIAASYTALDIAARIGEVASRWGSTAWLATAAVSMGGGIWAMHFVAMLAYSVPGMAVAFDPWLTSLSLLMAIAVTGVGFSVVAKGNAGPKGLILSGLFMGSGILAMHYVGMAAMQMDATLSYDVTWVAISIFIAMGAAIAALWLAFRGGGFVERVASALAMGLAISGMHFAGMQAATFQMRPEMKDMPIGAGVNQGNLALAISAITFLILLAAIVAAMFDRRIAALVSQDALALRRSEEQFRSLYRRTPLPLHALDEDGKIEDVSDAWLSLLVYSRDAVIGRPLINFMTEESARKRLHDWKRLLVEGELRDREYRLVTRAGEFVDVLSTSRVERDADGVFVRAVGGLVDVTARKRAEEALRQAQKMEAVGQLTGGIAHDFNNILAVILGNLEMIRKRVPEGDRLVRMVDNATEGAKRGAALTQRMLSFSRRQTLNPQSLDIGALVKGMDDLLRRSLGPRAKLQIEIPADLPPLFSDPHQLEMALLNLVVNARDAMEEGVIVVSAGAASSVPAQLPAGRYAYLSVSDDGEGMDEATLARAREPFFTTKGVGKGTGLGLSMVSGFVEQSGGALDISSRMGEGTKIVLWLPVATKSPSEELPVGKQDKRSLAGKAILVVDDEPLLLMSTEAMLIDMGAKALLAGSALEALEVMRQHADIACLVTDYAMPGMTGAQLAAAARVKKPGLPVLIATGYAEVPEEVSNYAVLQKPFSGSDLSDAISALLS